jgi:hypothetical protein
MEDGSGLGNLIPELNNSKYLGTPDIACLIIKGRKDSLFQNNQYLVREMPGFPDLSATEIANLVNYINHKFHNDFAERSINQISKDLAPCASEY